MQKIFVYNNIIGNYCSGDYYFVAEDQPTSYHMANEFAANHNNRVRNNPSYTIEWDKEGVIEYPIVFGYLSLNRIQLDVEK
jgi:hypothetical protein